MTNVHIVGNYGYGIALRWGGAISLRHGSIVDNLGDIGFLIENGHGELINAEVSSNAHDGIVVNVNGNLTMIGGKVDLHEQGTGITANLSSSVELEGVSVSNNETGISALSGSAAAINNSTINGNTNTGVFLSTSSSAIIDSTAIYENRRGVAATRHSFVTLNGPTEVRDNWFDGLRLLFGSGAVVSNGVSIPTHPSGWAVYCRDAESNLSNRAGVGPTNCEGFNLL
jgi:nitrous oxidase accessory protein NosD